MKTTCLPETVVVCPGCDTVHTDPPPMSCDVCGMDLDDCQPENILNEEYDYDE